MAKDKTAALRQQRSRDKKAALLARTLSVVLPPEQMAMLHDICVARAGLVVEQSSGAGLQPFEVKPGQPWEPSELFAVWIKQELAKFAAEKISAEKSVLAEQIKALEANPGLCKKCNHEGGCIKMSNADAARCNNLEKCALMPRFDKPTICKPQKKVLQDSPIEGLEVLSVQIRPELLQMVDASRTHKALGLMARPPASRSRAIESAIVNLYRLTLTGAVDFSSDDDISKAIKLMGSMNTTWSDHPNSKFVGGKGRI